MLALMRGVVIATYFFMHHSVFWHHRFSTSLVAQILAVGGLLALTQARGEPGLALGLCGIGIMLGYNYFASLYYSTTGSRDKGKGAASGSHEGTLCLGLAGGALAGGFVGFLGGTRAPYWLAMCVVAALIVVQIFVFLGRVRPLSRACRLRRPVDSGHVSRRNGHPGPTRHPVK
jgi:hypothetical protein